ncbi:MAG TPA: NAD(P)H-binding protein [Mycobacteriales bacterium]|nr:NAD(P)H-binding protein [Mycobacteriales bacterium]
MPVVVTGADTALGELVIDALCGQGLDLRATVEDRTLVADLVARGVKTAVSDLVDAERFGAVLEDAHTVIHLRGSDGGPGAVLDGIDDVLAAAPDSGVARIVTIAPLGRDSAAYPALERLDGSEYDTVVLHVGVVLAPLTDPRAEVPPLADGAMSVAPLWVGDLAAALVAADRLRDVHGHLHLDAVGADVVTSAELMARLGVPVGVAPGAALGVPLPRADGQQMVGDRSERLREVLGVVPRPLDEAVRLALTGL